MVGDVLLTGGLGREHSLEGASPTSSQAEWSRCVDVTETHAWSGVGREESVRGLMGDA